MLTHLTMSEIVSSINPIIKPSSNRMEILRGIKDAFPVMIGFIPIALVLGAKATEKNFSILEVPLLTGINFGGGSEFSAIALWTSVPHVLLIVAMTLLVNSRHLLMGAVLAPYLSDKPKKVIFPALFLMCDETWALGLKDARSKNFLSPAYYFSVGLSLYFTWVIFTFVGAVFAPMIGDLSHYGFDMAFPAVFVVLIRGMWTTFNAARPWLVSLCVAILVYLFIPGAWYVPAGALSGLLASYIWAESK